MFEVATIPFQSMKGFVSIRDNRSGEIFACPKSICEVFEISWSSQRQKLIMNSQRWSYKTIMTILPGDIQQREVGVIPDKKVRSWICGISPEKIKPEIREQLIAFQDECDAVLCNYWVHGVAVNPRFVSSEDKEFLREAISTEVKNAVKEMMEQFTSLSTANPSLGLLRQEFEAAEALAVKFYPNKNQALLAANNVLKEKYHQDVFSLLQVELISDKKEKLLTPTEIGQTIGLSAREVNKKLERAGLQEKILNSKTWIATDQGKQFCEYLDTGKKHNSGSPVQQIKWYETVLEVLRRGE